MNTSEQIRTLWAANQADIGMVWFLLPHFGQAETTENATNLQTQITSDLLKTPFLPEEGRQIGEQLAQQFSLSLEKLGYLQRLLAEQLLRGLTETQAAWLAPRLATYWSEMTVGYSYELNKLYQTGEAALPQKILAHLQQAAEGEKHFAALFNDTFSPVVLHENGLILAVNEAVTEVFGYSAEELVGQKIQKLVNTLVPESEKIKILRYVGVGHHHTYKSKCFHKTGTLIDFEVTASPLIYNGRRVRMIVLRPLSIASITTPDEDEVNLTARQQEVLHFMALGVPNKEIAGKLHISPSTVKHHKQQIIKKLGVKNQAEAVIWAWQKLRLLSSLTIK